MGFFPGESLVRPAGWLRKAEGGATLIPCPSGFGRLDIFSRFTTGTKRLYMERGCRLGGREAGPGPQTSPEPSPFPAVELGWAPAGVQNMGKGDPMFPGASRRELQREMAASRSEQCPSPHSCLHVCQPLPGLGSGLVSGSLQPFLTRGCPSGSSPEAGGHGSGTPGPSPWRRFWWNLGPYKLGPDRSLHGISESWQGLEVGVGPGRKAC